MEANPGLVHVSARTAVRNRDCATAAPGLRREFCARPGRVCDVVSRTPTIRGVATWPATSPSAASRPGPKSPERPSLALLRLVPAVRPVSDGPGRNRCVSPRRDRDRTDCDRGCGDPSLRAGEIEIWSLKGPRARGRRPSVAGVRREELKPPALLAQLSTSPAPRGKRGRRRWPAWRRS
jgi:hypothetical protein